MKLSNFDFELPEDLLALYPAEHRDESRLMVLNKKDQTIEHKQFKDVINYFDEGDVLMLNNTKVFPARMFGNKEKTGARIEVFLLRELNAENRLWDVLVDPARKIRIGNKLFFGDDDSLVAEVIDNTTSRGRTLRFLFDGSYEAFREKLIELGETPLPKAINREVEPLDKERYQTVYAQHDGAVAAPTAGLHFDEPLLERLKDKGIEFGYVTLHVGAGTFQPVQVDDVNDHTMHSEYVDVDQALCDQVNAARARGNRVIAVGTTSVRSLESASQSGSIQPFNDDTQIFIYPGYEFKSVDALITNFHLPESTLIMLVSAFAGKEHTLNAYEAAINDQYRFLLAIVGHELPPKCNDAVGKGAGFDELSQTRE